MTQPGLDLKLLRDSGVLTARRRRKRGRPLIYKIAEVAPHVLAGMVMAAFAVGVLRALLLWTGGNP